MHIEVQTEIIQTKKKHKYMETMMIDENVHLKKNDENVLRSIYIWIVSTLKIVI